MHKAFDLNTALTAYLLYLRNGQFPCENDAGKSKRCKSLYPCTVVDGHLRTRMQRKGRCDLLCYTCRAEILHQYSICSNRGKKGEIFL